MKALVYHGPALEDTMAAYDTFADAADSGALKVVLCGPQSTSEPAKRVAAAVGAA